MYPFYAKDIMNPDVITVRPDMMPEDLVEVFTANKISGAPVVDREGMLIGVISLYDILTNTGMNMLYSPDYFEEARIDHMLAQEGLHLDPATLGEGFVSDYMTHNVYTALPDTPLPELARTMFTHRIHRIIILKPDTRKPVGIVSTFDVLKVLAETPGSVSEEKTKSAVPTRAG